MKKKITYHCTDRLRREKNISEELKTAIKHLSVSGTDFFFALIGRQPLTKNIFQKEKRIENFSFTLKKDFPWPPEAKTDPIGFVFKLLIKRQPQLLRLYKTVNPSFYAHKDLNKERIDAVTLTQQDYLGTSEILKELKAEYDLLPQKIREMYGLKGFLAEKKQNNNAVMIEYDLKREQIKKVDNEYSRISEKLDADICNLSY